MAGLPIMAEVGARIAAGSGTRLPALHADSPTAIIAQGRNKQRIFFRPLFLIGVFILPGGLHRSEAGLPMSMNSNQVYELSYHPGKFAKKD